MQLVFKDNSAESDRQFRQNNAESDRPFRQNSAESDRQFRQNSAQFRQPFTHTISQNHNFNPTNNHFQQPNFQQNRHDIDFLESEIGNGVDNRRDSRKSTNGNTYFQNSPVDSDKRATSYTKVSLTKPFDFEDQLWATISTTTTPTVTTTHQIPTTTRHTTTTTSRQTTTTRRTTTATTQQTTTTTATTTEPRTTQTVHLYFTQSTTELPKHRSSEEETELFDNFLEEEEKVSNNQNIDSLPIDHPLRQVIPDSARIVGVQPESSFLNPHVMTLGQFLKVSRDMDKIHAIRVPLEDKKHVDMIERLAGN